LLTCLTTACQTWQRLLRGFAFGEQLFGEASTTHPSSRVSCSSANFELPADDALFRLVAETTSEGLQFCDLNGIIQYSNPAHHRMFGYVPPALIGRHRSACF